MQSLEWAVVEKRMACHVHVTNFPDVFPAEEKLPQWYIGTEWMLASSSVANGSSRP